MSVVYIVRTSVHPSHEAQWRRWQDTEHVPQLLALPGYRGVQRFRDLDRAGTYLNLWTLDDRRAQQGPAYRAASLTPWFERLRPFYDVEVDFSAAPDRPAPAGMGGLVVVRWDPDSGVLLERVEAELLAGPADAVRLAPLVEEGTPAPRSAPSTVVLTYLPDVPAPVTAPAGIDRRRYVPLTG